MELSYVVAHMMKWNSSYINSAYEIRAIQIKKEKPSEQIIKYSGQHLKKIGYCVTASPDGSILHWMQGNLRRHSPTKPSKLPGSRDPPQESSKTADNLGGVGGERASGALPSSCSHSSRHSALGSRHLCRVAFWKCSRFESLIPLVVTPTNPLVY